ncbi:MAG: CRISPR-associated endonuclease Cas3'' [Chloroflexi bacterium]|nr:CRISPR-associated endonuclease Cas3'' [Chloroflexota bacterium]
MERSSEFLLMWAKTGRGGSTFHPLLCHAIDVAAVAHAMWQQVLSAAARRRFAQELGIGAEDAGRWTAFWAGLHDIGKASPAFALKDPQARARIASAGYACPSFVPQARHGVVTARTLPPMLAELGIEERLASRVSVVLGGHHGTFPRSGEVLDTPSLAVGAARWVAARRSVFEWLSRHLRIGETAKPQNLDNAGAMLLAGLVSIADWIGSAEEYFPHAMDEGEAFGGFEVAEYAERSQARAFMALQELGWLTPTAPPVSTFESVFPGLERRHLQDEISRLSMEISAPCLVIVEAPMGEGKTEAAMYLAHHWGWSGGRRGMYFALPTQATSNQMFGRVRDFLAARHPGETVNLQLAHGQAALSRDFQQIRGREHGVLQLGEVHGEDSYDGAPANVAAAEWFAQRKRALLAPYGVGTIDQALMAALQTRHVFVRQFGLAHKTIIVDEVHAYDTYMSALLERLLEWLAALGSSVILLSATLPEKRRRALIEAYTRGLPDAARMGDCQDPAYPRVSWATHVGAGARHVEASGHLAKAVTLSWLDAPISVSTPATFPLGKVLQAVLADGGCAVVICDTVSRAQQTYLALRPFFTGIGDDGWPELDLLHARYTVEQRSEREIRTMVRFGKPDGSVVGEDGRRQPVRRLGRAVLVATQIVEQSLDLDFDLMASDIAPVDLVLQRLGRLHRHARRRPAALANPQLWLLGPESVDSDVPVFGRGIAKVYDEHILLRSWLVLKDAREIRVPGDVERMVEAVYSSDARCPPDVGEAFRRRWDETLKLLDEQACSDRIEAAARWVKRPNYDGALWRLSEEPREEDAPDFHLAHQALTRLSDPSVQVVCVYGPREHPHLDEEGYESLDLEAVPPLAEARRLLMRSVSVSDRRVVYSLLADSPPQGWRRSALLRHHRLVVFDAGGAASVGGHRLVLDQELGLVIDPATKEED